MFTTNPEEPPRQPSFSLSASRFSCPARGGAPGGLHSGRLNRVDLHRKLCDHLVMSFPRITVRADQMGGVPCVRGLRIPVATVVGMVADGMDEEEILAAYPDLEAEDIREAMRYAAEAVRERELPLAAAG